MYYNHNLRVNLKEWRNRLIKTSIDQFDNGHKYFFDKLKTTPALFAYLADSQFIPEEGFFDTLNWDYEVPEFRFASEEHEAIIRFYMIEYLLAQPDTTISGWLMNLVGGSNLNESINQYVEVYIDPIVNYLSDQLDEGSAVLYLLEKYKLRCEWFYKQRLTELYQSNSKTGENKLEEDLRLFLFEQGIDYPFSTPLSASGRADVISMLHTDDPLVVEIKIYDESKNYRKNRIVDGFSQVVKYATDYHKNVGYLVTFVIDPVNFEIQGAEHDKAWPNRVTFEGKSYYLIFINLSSELTASQSGKIKKQVITIEDLTSTLA
jgi:hypothetical protein